MYANLMELLESIHKNKEKVKFIASKIETITTEEEREIFIKDAQAKAILNNIPGFFTMTMDMLEDKGFIKKDDVVEAMRKEASEIMSKLMGAGGPSFSPPDLGEHLYGDERPE